MNTGEQRRWEAAGRGPGQRTPAGRSVASAEPGGPFSLCPPPRSEPASVAVAWTPRARGSEGSVSPTRSCVSGRDLDPTSTGLWGVGRPRSELREWP